MAKKKLKSKKVTVFGRKVAREIVIGAAIVVIVIVLGALYVFSRNRVDDTQKAPVQTVTVSKTPTMEPSATPTPTVVAYVPPANTPTPAYNFPAIVNKEQIFGQVSISCDGVSGFAFDPVNPGNELRYDIAYEPSDSSIMAGGYVWPVDLGSPDVDSFYKITGNHRLSHGLDSYYRSDKPMKVQVFAGKGMNFDGRTELLGSPQTITCPK